MNSNFPTFITNIPHLYSRFPLPGTSMAVFPIVLYKISFVSAGFLFSVITFNCCGELNQFFTSKVSVNCSLQLISFSIMSTGNGRSAIPSKLYMIKRPYRIPKHIVACNKVLYVNGKIIKLWRVYFMGLFYSGHCSWIKYN